MALNPNHESSNNSLPPNYEFSPTAPAVTEKRIEGGVLEGDETTRTRKGGLKVGARIAPVLPHLRGADFSDSDSVNGTDVLEKQLELESGNALQYRTCSWQKVSIGRALRVIRAQILTFSHRLPSSSSQSTSAWPSCRFHGPTPFSVWFLGSS